LTRTSSPRNSQKTALVVAVVFAAIAGWQIYRGRPTTAMVLGACAVLLGVTAAVPPAARVFHRAWWRFAEALGFINSSILLSVFYFLVMMPVGFLMRLLGRDPLSRRENKRDTYWIPRASTRQVKASFERSF